MQLTQEQIDVIEQNLRRQKIKIEILDFNFKTIDSIEGYAIDGSITANADNAIRRSGNITLAIPLDYSAITFLDKVDGITISLDGKIWIDKYVRILVGIENILSTNNEIIWYKLGVFLIDSPKRIFNATNYTISFDCIDLMAKLTGSRQGQLTGMTTLIEKGYYTVVDEETVYQKVLIADALISVITELGGISKYIISPIPDVYKYLPYDIKVGVGETVYDLLKTMLDILSTWEMFFDVDGVLTIRPIPSGKKSIIYDLNDAHYDSDEINLNFSNVKNQVVVYGRLNTLNYYTEDTESSATISTGESLGITSASLNLETFEMKISTSGTYDFIYNETYWEYDGSEVILGDYGITIVGDPIDNDIVEIVYTEAVDDNVMYSPNGDGTETLILKYTGIDVDTLTISGTNLGFHSEEAYNLLPINKVEIWNNGSKIIYSHDDIEIKLTKFENSNTEFGIEYDTTQIEVNDIIPKNIYFIRIFDATLTTSETVDLTKNITFEFMGKQQVAYTLVNDNLESPFYINAQYSNQTNFYAGLAYVSSEYKIGENYLLTLNNQSAMTSLEDGSIITFMANANNIYSIFSSTATTITIRTQDDLDNILVSDIPLLQNSWNITQTERPPVVENKLSDNFTIWKIRYDANYGSGVGCFVLIGRAESALTQIFSGDDYDNIYSDQLAYERCLWELFLHSNMENTINISCIPNYLIDVNNKIIYDENNALPSSVYLNEPFLVKVPSSTEYQQMLMSNGKIFYVKVNGIKYYITKQINYPLGINSSSQKITAIEIYDSGNLVSDD